MSSSGAGRRARWFAGTLLAAGAQHQVHFSLSAALECPRRRLLTFRRVTEMIYTDDMMMSRGGGGRGGTKGREFHTLAKRAQNDWPYR